MAKLPTAGGVILLLAALSRADAATIIVSNTNDLVNGSTSSPTALTARPGPDGISLREAITAANNAAGPHTIIFAPSLTGKVIVLKSPLPPIKRSGIAIIGRTKSGKPAIGIDAEHANNTAPTVFIGASSFTMRNLRFTFVPDSHTVQIGGILNGVFTPARQISNVKLIGNIFSDVGHNSNGFAICIKTSGLQQGPTNDNTISEVVIAHNTFSKMFEAISFAVGGNRNVVKDVVIFRNTFTAINVNGPRNDGSPIEIAGNGKANQILGTQILENVFSGNLKGIDINNNASEPDLASGNIIKDTLVARNFFAGNTNSLIQFEAGVDSAKNNRIVSTNIVNNLFQRTGSDIGIAVGDNDQSAVNNHVIGLSFANNTVVGGMGGGIGVASSGGVTGVAIVNSILANGEMREITATQVHNSITTASGISGVNDNMNVDPQFVDAAHGNFHLQATSLAIGAGTAIGAPTDDINCRIRRNPPSIGAYESTNGGNRCPDNWR